MTRPTASRYSSPRTIRFALSVSAPQAVDPLRAHSSVEQDGCRPEMATCTLEVIGKKRVIPTLQEALHE
jgi:hypothetical protein